MYIGYGIGYDYIFLGENSKKRNEYYANRGEKTQNIIIILALIWIIALWVLSCIFVILFSRCMSMTLDKRTLKE